MHVRVSSLQDTVPCVSIEMYHTCCNWCPYWKYNGVNVVSQGFVELNANSLNITHTSTLYILILCLFFLKSINQSIKIDRAINIAAQPWYLCHLARSTLWSHTPCSVYYQQLNEYPIVRQAHQVHCATELVFGDS